MLKEMRRKDRQLSKEEAMELLNRGEYGTLSTMGPEYPYAVPVNYVVIDDTIYFHGTCDSGQKTEYIEANPHVCFTVVGETEVLASKFSERYESIVVLGKAAMADDTQKVLALEALIDKYSAEFKEDGMRYVHGAKEKVSVYGIEIEQITGKARR